MMTDLTLDPSVVQALQGISTATITTILFKQGLRNIWLRGPKPLYQRQARIVGRAFTMRFIPAREDLATPEAWSSPRSTRVAIEAMPVDSVIVADAMGVTDAGIVGDILCARMAQRGVKALITDGVVRDITGVRATGLPIWAQGTAAPAAVSSLHFVNWNEPVACGGVAVFPGDILVADDDGVVVIPDAYLERVLEQGSEQEDLEAWIFRQVEKGAALPGMYPPSVETLERYAREREGDGH